MPALSWRIRPRFLTAVFLGLGLYIFTTTGQVECFTIPRRDQSRLQDLLHLYKEPPHPSVEADKWYHDQEPGNDRRSFLQSVAWTTAIVTGSQLATPEVANAIKDRKRFSVVQGKFNSTSASAIRQPMRDSTLFAAGLGTESCLLKLLPVKNSVFRTIEDDIKYLKLSGMFSALKLV